MEAKAHCSELSPQGKRLKPDSSDRSKENHRRIGQAIDEACAGWQLIDKGVHISMDEYYQLANRLAFTWKLAALGVPVILVYLGFTGDTGIRGVGKPFSDETHWKEAFKKYVSSRVPMELFDRRLNITTVPVWLLCRSLPVIEVSPSN